MPRKKVKTETIKDSGPKKRPTKQPEKKRQVIRPSDGKPSRWDKVKGVDGKIVRYTADQKEKMIEMGQLIQKGKARRMCVGVDGDKMYHYFEIFKEK